MAAKVRFLSVYGELDGFADRLEPPKEAINKANNYKRVFLRLLTDEVGVLKEVWACPHAKAQGVGLYAASPPLKACFALLQGAGFPLLSLTRLCLLNLFYCLNIFIFVSMRWIWIVAFFIPFWCHSQVVTKEKFLSDMIADTIYYSADDMVHNTTLVDLECNYEFYWKENPFEKPKTDKNGLIVSYSCCGSGFLPDSSFQQMKESIGSDSSKTFQWIAKDVHLPSSKRVCFVNDKDVALLLDHYTQHRKASNKKQEKIIQKRLAQIDSVKRFYANADGAYNISRPVFDKNYSYAIIHCHHYCAGLCGDGWTGLYQRIDDHWVRVAFCCTYVN